MTCTNVILAQPQAGASIDYTIPEGESARLSFGPEDIDGLSLNDNGGLNISFADGGNLTIANFESLVDGGNLLYLADGTLVDPKLLKSGLTSTMTAEAANDNDIMIGLPADGVTREVTLERGKDYIFSFELTDPRSAVTQDGQFTMTFDNGGKIVLTNYEEAMAWDFPPQLSMESKVCKVTNGELVETIEALVMGPLGQEDKAEEEELVQSNVRKKVAGDPSAEDPSAQDLASIEPAAGEDVAQQLAQIEPAAGEGPIGNSGYGFNSSPGSDPLEGKPAIGPLDPTALRYVAPEFKQENFIPDEEQPQNPENPMTTSPAGNVVDESNLGPLVATGTVPVDFGADGPGGITPNGTVVVDCSVNNGVLASGGVPVIITATANGYTGTAGGVTVFTFVVDPLTGAYTYTQLEPFDHADGTDPNDEICFDFGLTITDGDGDTIGTSVIIKVRDDAPVAENDSNAAGEGQTVTGDVFVNDTFSKDDPTKMTSVTFNGTTQAMPDGGSLVIAGNYGTLTINSDGTYSYTANTNNPDGTDVFTYVLTDYDGDSDPATLSIRVSPDDDKPLVLSASDIVDETNLAGGTITETGTISVDYGSDGPGVVAGNGAFDSSGSRLGGNLTSNGVPVNVTFAGGVYTGTAGGVTVFTLSIAANGNYEFKLFEQLDHADGTDPNDIINLEFGVKATDSDGDTSNSTLVVKVKDDAPHAEDDKATLEDGKTVSGNVVTNDSVGQDIPGRVTAVSFNGASTTVPDGGSATIVGTYGTLVISSTGAYTYTAKPGVDGNDEFIYTLRDYDGDKDTAKLEICVSKDDTPILVQPEKWTIDETNLDGGPIVVGGDLNADFGSDGPGTFAPTGTFNSDGSKLGGNLVHNGVPITVTLTGNTYTGTAGGVTIFTMQVLSNGDYEFKLFENLDHADPNDPNDIIRLNFGIEARDNDGDTAQGFINISVKDDVPTIEESNFSQIDESDFNGGPISLTDTLTFDFGEDGPGEIVPNGNFMAMNTQGGPNITVTSGGVPVVVTATANGYVGVAGGVTIFKLSIDPLTGEFTYTQFEAIDHPDTTDPDDVIWLKFFVDIVDYDGDKDTTVIGIDVHDDGPRLNTAQETVDETDLSGGPIVETGSVTGDFGADGVGSFAATGDFASSGSKLGGNLTSNGVPVTVAFSAGTGTYTGTAGGATVFTMTINADGTYTFTLFDTLDHADPNDPNDIINLDFGAAGTDGDGDPAETTIRVRVKDDVPTIGDAEGGVDETNLGGGPLVFSDVLDHNFGLELGSITPNGAAVAMAGGANIALTSGGVPVVITQTATGYTGTAGGVTVFTLTINTATGQYTYTQNEELDHPNAADHNDVIQIKFPVKVTSLDGDNDTGTITINVYDDGPVANDDITGAEEGQFITGNVVANDELSEDHPNIVTKVTFGGTDYAVPNGGSAVIVTSLGTLTMNSNGTYTYTATNVGDPNGTDVFTYTLRDDDGDIDTAKLSVRVTPDGEPVAVDELLAIDETNLTPGPVIFNGTLNIDFGADGAGTVAANGTFSSGGSQLGGNLTSNTVPVVVTLAGNVYTGRAGGVDIFTLTINNDGTYAFQLLEHIDHADGTDPNDIIRLNFGVTVTDADGDSANGTVSVDVYDDAPVAYDDGRTVVESATVTGNVTTNDELSEDQPNTVIKIVFNGTDHTVPAAGNVVIAGAYGTLTINAQGQYSYTANSNNPDGTDVFTYTLRDFDGDKDTAELSFVVTSIDDQPVVLKAIDMVDETNLSGGVIVETGTVSVDYGDDGPGTVMGTGTFSANGSLLGGALTHNGQAINVTFVGNTYTGTANGVTVFTMTIAANGNYEFRLLEQIDHADGTNPNDIINLEFGVKATDSDGDVGTNKIIIQVKDDAPVANDDKADVEDNKTVSGNVTDNDVVGQDVPGRVISISFNGTEKTVPAGGSTSIDGLFGTLVIHSNGSFTYTAKDGVDGTDNFTYVLRDYDGDRDPAVLSVCVALDDNPVVIDKMDMVDETDLSGGVITKTGTINVDFGGDAPGTVMGTGTFTSSGSKTGGVLSHNGTPVTVSFAGGTYTGTAGGITVFTLKVNANGTYEFKLFEELDHADGTDPNDIINLEFGVKATDSDGDVGTGKVIVKVKDDAPTIQDQFKPVDETDLKDGPLTLNGTVPHSFGQDGPGMIMPNGTFMAVYQANGQAQQLTAGGVPVVVTQNGNGYVGMVGNVVIFTLTINATTGAYTYKQFEAVDHPDGTNPDDVIWLKFGIKIVDGDGDIDEAFIGIDVHDDGPKAHDDKADIEDGKTATGNVMSNDQVGADDPGRVTKVQFGATSYDVPNGGSVTVQGTYGTLVLHSNGSYTYTAKNGVDGTDSFIYTLRDYDGDKDTAKLEVCVTKDDKPILIDPAMKIVDETNLSGGTITETGQIQANFFGDGPGTYAGTGAFTSSGSKTGGVLSHNGTPVTVNYSNGTYTGTANGVTVFTLVINPTTGGYTFKLFEELDHADGTDPNDIINLEFGIKATDTDGDTDDSVLVVKVKDDAPTIGDKFTPVDETNLKNGPLTTGGTVPHSFGQDGPGMIMPNGTFMAVYQTNGQAQQLKSGGQNVVVTQNGNGYVGMVGNVVIFTLTINASTGQYEYKQFEAVDHPDGTNPDDVIWLKFGIKIVDGDGDIDEAFIGIDVHDDGPDAHDDKAFVEENKTATGNVMSNDLVGADEPGWVSKVQFGGNSYDIPTGGSATVVGAYGTLVIHSNGSYTYTAKDNVDGSDFFTYTLRDYDGDKDTAKLEVCVTGKDDNPVIVNASDMVDETNLSGGTITETGTISVNYGGDGPGTVMGTGTFSSNGSKLGGNLTHNGSAVNVSFSGSTYTGTAAGKTIFTLKVNANGTYEFKLFEQLDHADGSNPNDEINLVFGVKATDSDGDVGTGTVTIIVKDDAPDARNDGAFTVNEFTSVTGNVMNNDTVGQDTPGRVTTITFGGTTINVPTSGTVAIDGQWGTLRIAANGSYTYTADSVTRDRSDVFTYKLTDYDGDTDTATISFNIRNGFTGGDGGGGDGGGDGCPLVFDMDGDGIELISKAESGVLFDIDEDGIADRTAWVAADDAILVRDRNDDGTINDHGEMFGTDTRGGFDVLSDYDSNGDGVIDANDAIWDDLQIWQDKNQDGVSQAGELVSVKDAGFKSISLSTTGYNQTVEGSFVGETGTVTKTDGSTLDGYDAWFEYDSGADRNLTEIDGIIKNLIDVAGNGAIQALEGADNFLFHAIGDGSAHQIDGFNAEEGDSLDLSMVLEGRDDVTDAINAFVYAREEGGSTVISVDASGSGDVRNAVDIAKLDGVTDMDVTEMMKNGNIVL